MQKDFFNYKLITSWVVLLSFVLFVVFESSSSITNAQQTNGQLSVSCAPNKDYVMRNQEVVFIATVKNATEKIKYSWSGTKIQNVDAPRVTASYGSLGKKKAQVTIVTGGTRLKAECSTIVVTTLPNQQNQQQGGNNPAQQQGGNNPLSQLGQQGGQQGGTTGGQQTGQQGAQQGGSNTGSTQSPTTGGQQTSSPQSESAARQKARQDYLRRQQQIQQDYEKDVKQCDQDKGDSAKKTQEAIIESQQEIADQQQMVPVNPIPIVDPIENIKENIERLTLKDIGLSGGNSPALDKVRACKVDALLKSFEAKSINTLKRGRDGNTMYVTNYGTLIEDMGDIGSKKFIEAYANAPTCKQDENKNIAETLAYAPRAVIGARNEKTYCEIGEEKNDLDEYIDQADPTINTPYKLAEAYTAMLGYRSSLVQQGLYETEINRGFIGEKDENGNITTPPEIYLTTNLNNLNITTNRAIQIDEEGEQDSALFNDFVQDVGLQIPT